MGVLRFILGVFGFLLVLGTFGAFLGIAFLSAIITRSIGFGLLFPILLIAIGAAMMYYGFVSKGR